MEDSEIEKLKRVRAAKLGAFTRKCTFVLQLLDNNAMEKLEESFEALQKLYKEAEDAFEAWTVEADEGEVDANQDYLNGATNSLGNITVRVSEMLKNRKTQEDLKEKQNRQEREQTRLNQEREDNLAAERRACDRAKAEFLSSIDTFGKPTDHIKRLIDTDVLSVHVKEELEKIEDTYNRMSEERDRIMGMNPTAINAAESEDFKKRATNEVECCKAMAFAYIKANPMTTV